MKRATTIERVVLIVYALFITAAARGTANEAANSSRKVLHILTTAPYPMDSLDDVWNGGLSLISAVRLAVKQINSKADILEGYELEAIEDNSGCDITPTSTITFFRNSLYSRKKIIGVIGPACSGPTLVLAPLLARKEISLIQIAPTATSPRIVAENYTTTFSLIGSSVRVIDSYLALMMHNGWTRVATLYDIDRDTFSAFNFKLLEKINEQEHLTVVYTSHVLTDTRTDAFIPLERIVSRRARVIFLLTRRSTALKVLCLAYHMDMIYPLYQWIISAETRLELENGVENFTLRHERTNYQCTQEIIYYVLNGSIAVSYNLQTESTSLHTYTNLTYAQYRELYLKETREHFEELEAQNQTQESSGNWENAYYDATWAFGLALDRASRKGLNLSQYGQGQPAATRQLSDELLSLSFRGATGLVSFTDERNIESIVVISQLWTINGSIHETLVATYEENTLHFSNVTQSSFISDVFNNVPEYIHSGVGYTVIVLAAILALITGAFQLAFIAWSDRKWIKAASPDVNHLIFSGCYLFALAAMLFSLQETTDLGLDSDGHTLYYSVVCNVITWFLLTGYTLIFGTAFIKIWRVYRLFKHFKNKKPTCLKDKVLISAVSVLLVIDASFCTIWNILDPWVREETPSGQAPVGDMVSVTQSCKCMYMFYWIGVTAAYKGGIAILLVVISTLNRKIQRAHFQHTKKVNILVYSLTILYGAGFPLYFLLTGVSIYVSYFIMCTLMLGTVLLCCCMLFVSPVFNVIKTKLGKY